jgi:hypothetical protein
MNCNVNICVSWWSRRPWFDSLLKGVETHGLRTTLESPRRQSLGMSKREFLDWLIKVGWLSLHVGSTIAKAGVVLWMKRVRQGEPKHPSLCFLTAAAKPSPPWRTNSTLSLGGKINPSFPQSHLPNILWLFCCSSKRSNTLTTRLPAQQVPSPPPPPLQLPCTAPFSCAVVRSGHYWVASYTYICSAW